MDKKIRVTMLGNFQMIIGDKTLNQTEISSNKVSKLLAYLLLHRKQAVSTYDIIDAIWPDYMAVKKAENPLGALKNLVYRLRKLLHRVWPEDDFIITSHNSYRWSSDYPVELDVESVVYYFELAKKEESDVKQAEYLEHALNLFGGEFLNTMSDQHWVMGAAAYYHSIFLEAVEMLSTIYAAAGRYHEMETLCARGLQYDPLSEQLHCQLIRSYIHQKRRDKAQEQYVKAMTMMYGEAGMDEPENLVKLYNDIVDMKIKNGVIAMNENNNVIRDKKIVMGAYVCSYSAFMELYRLEVRRMERLGISGFVLMMTLSLPDRLPDDKGTVKYEIERLMKSIKYVLRGGDIITQNGDGQVIILLPDCGHQAGQKIERRLISEFYQRGGLREAEVRCDMGEIGGKSALDHNGEGLCICIDSWKKRHKEAR